MVICKRRGCGVDFQPEAAKEAGQCTYHPGAPVFHEGLKSWSCCRETNKPVMEFDQFLALKGCATAPEHTTEAQAPAPTQVPGGKVASTAEVSQTAEALDNVKLKESAPAPSNPAPLAPMAAPKPSAPKEPAPEPKDPETLQAVPKGTRCQRPGCNFTAEDDIPMRDRANESCRYHRGTPIFHEGSKGYTCCKRRVLHFDDFLGIEPCTTAEHGHLFAPPVPKDGATVDCRIDHYETPADVRITVYAKSVVAENSTIDFGADEVRLDLELAPVGSITHTRRFARTLHPYAAIDPEKSSYTIGKMKLDMVLVKAASGQSWPALERGDPVYGYGVTFGNKR
ncbi:uncharacterized protein MJAP1_000822 [Malassezia japonica]|uniref:Chord-domain-containing protein n=1 Tax=Malassezia japonica TaxID=223818 RepID=A0AAF0J991_9BASI|nr:uncharacterized protein MJAP1_000822 [Malassezia japonica]WFD37875.1 hypothetical protein MJAP1_000822 [Malassezia japonica]